MPLYEYECKDCGFIFEVLQGGSDPDPKACETCGAGRVRRIMSQSAFHLKGGGWYKTDYASGTKSPKSVENKPKPESSATTSSASPPTSSD